MSAGRRRFRSAAARGADAGRPAGRPRRRLEQTLVSLTELAQDELESWELSAMRDPRNWVRARAAAVIGASAGTALVVLRVRGRHRARKQQSASHLELAGRTVQRLRRRGAADLPER